MREIIVLGLGGAGIRIGDQFLKQMAKEHHIDPTNGLYEEHSNKKESLDNPYVFFSEKESSMHQSFAPRVLFSDFGVTDCETQMNKQENSKFYSQDQFVYTQELS